MVTVALIALQCIAIPASSAEEPKFTFGLELYDANSLPQGGTPPGTARQLNPLQLRVNQEVAVAVRYSDLDVMNYNGIQCLAASFSYDESRFELNYFETGDGGTVLWEVGEMLSSEWIPEALQYGYTASASDRKTEKEGIRRVYIQYIAEGDRSSGTVCTENDAYVGAFYFTVKQAIAESEGVCFGWSDYAVGLYSDDAFTDDGVTNYNRAALQADMEHFEEPADVPVATVEQPPEPEGVTVSGVVNTFAPNREGRVVLYPYTEVGVAPKYYDVHNTVYETELQATFGGPSEPQSSTAANVDFQIESVPAGTYLLVVVKPGNTHFVVENLVVGNYNIDLTTESYPVEIQRMSLIPGDINGDGLVEGNDSGILFRSANWRKSGDAIDNTNCDINGDGMVEGNDSAIIYRSAHWRKGDVTVTLP